MIFSHNEGTIGFKVRLCTALLSQKRNNIETFILPIFAKVSPSLHFLPLDIANLVFQSRKISTLVGTFANDSCRVVISKFVVCANARPSDLNKTHRKS